MTTETSNIQNVDAYGALRKLRSGLRSDLQISRHSAKGQPAYMIYDPVSFQTHRLSLTDYQVVACLDDSRSIEQAFQRAVSEGHLSENDEPDFLQFVDRLDRLGLLNVSSQDGQKLYSSYQLKRTDLSKRRLQSFLFMTIPLSNPDKFLDRTVARFRFLFTKTAAIVWATLAIFAFAIVLNKWSDFVAPVSGLLAIKNLPFMLVAFIGLKIWHELGHGYACKNFGGRIPEMGCKLMAGMPLAYVDASSAWSFPKRHQRIIVMLGGMYFECIVAIVATFVWAFTPTSFLGACAYQLIFMAGVATIFFNANPLMKYDGYFILSDLTGITNLRARAMLEVTATLKRIVLGMEIPRNRSSQRWLLLSYGVLSSIYAGMLMVSIPMFLATQYQLLGLLVGCIQLTLTLYALPKQLAKYLLQSSETEPVRRRATAVAYSLAAGIPLLLLIVPVPTGILIEGVVSAERYAVLRAQQPGVLKHIGLIPQSEVRSNQTLATLQNLDAEAASEAGHIAVDTVVRAAHYVSRRDVAEGAKKQAIALERLANSQIADQAKAELQIQAPFEGRLAFILPKRAEGSYLFAGDPIAKLVAGKTVIRAWLDESQIIAADLRIGSKVQVRTADRAPRNHYGEIVRVAPASASQFEDLALTTDGEGQILVNPFTHSTNESLFQLEIAVPKLDSHETQLDARAYVLIGRRYESIGHWVVRSTRKFIDGILLN